MINRPIWKRTRVPLEWEVRIWERMAEGDSNSQVGKWLDQQDYHLDRGTLSQVRKEIEDLPEEIAKDLSEKVRVFRNRLRGEPIRST